MKSIREQLAEIAEKARIRTEEEHKAKEVQEERENRSRVVVAIGEHLKNLGFAVNTRKLFQEVVRGKGDAYYIWNHDGMAFTAYVTENDLDDDDSKFLVGIRCRVCDDFAFYPVITIEDFQRVVATEGTALHPECQRRETGEIDDVIEVVRT